ncbi:MAG TPA: ribose 5-phosphate isomerase B [Acidimicrobiales bacterium]|nr:ribose 5-phosphate isomerase B [Acidimicrobiales bacterium]
MRIAVASDHAGYRMKTVVAAHLAGAGHEVLDMGTNSDESVDYPPFCAAAGRAVVDGLADFGIVIGGSGQGEQIAANKVNGVRAALCHDDWMARMARMHNNANVLAFGARVLADARALDIVDLFLATEFEGGRHQPRIEQLADIETQECEKRGAAPPA